MRNGLIDKKMTNSYSKFEEFKKQEKYLLVFIEVYKFFLGNRLKIYRKLVF